MATNFPTSLDSYATLVDNVDAVLAAHMNDRASAIVALETKMGVDSSAVTTSVDYKLKNLPSQTGTAQVSNLNAALLGGTALTGLYIANSGDVKMTSSATVDSGWTDVSSTYSGYFIRISSGTALDTGGSDTHTHAGTTDSHVLTTAEMPSHTHNVIGGNSGNLVGGPVLFDATNSAGTPQATSSAGSDGGHTHTYTTPSANNIPVYVQLKMLKKT